MHPPFRCPVPGFGDAPSLKPHPSPGRAQARAITCVLCLFFSAVTSPNAVSSCPAGSPNAHADVLTIGVLVPSTGAWSSEGAAVKQGVQLAVGEARRMGIGVRVLVRSDDGLWGKGVAQVTATVFRDHADVLIGGVESTSAHIIEQIAMKARIPFLIAWSGDPTLTAAGVPFAFRCSPSGEAWARLLEGLIRRRGIVKRIGVRVICSDDRESRRSAAAFVQAGAPGGRAIGRADCWMVSSLAARTPPVGRGVPSPGVPATLASVVQRIRQQRDCTFLVFGPLSFWRTVRAQAPRHTRLLWYADVLPVDAAFRRKASLAHISAPIAAAACGYDAAWAAIRAAQGRHTGNGEALRRALMRLRYHGATGPLRFDTRGNRVSFPLLPAAWQRPAAPRNAEPAHDGAVPASITPRRLFDAPHAA
ncbi:MAG: ABC transporter substrate-binding protein [Chthonomonadales bacterium]